MSQAPADPTTTSEVWRVAAVQMVSAPEVGRNLDSARRLIAEAAAQGARIVALPEYFCLMGTDDRDKLAAAEAHGDGPIQRCLSEAARAHGVWLVGGTLPLRVVDSDGRPDPARVYNACLVYAPDGRAMSRYDKIHLFRFDNGRERYDESLRLCAGETPVVADLDGGAVRLGLSVCYDLRFPELYRTLMAQPDGRPCDLIAVPSAFTATTGRAHWETLLRARAIENQCYVVAPAQGGRHENGRSTWGHSLVVDPWGEVIACRPEGEGVVLADMDLRRLAAVRSQLPALAHRRGGLWRA